MPDTPIIIMLKKCDILFDGEMISNSLLISTFSSYISELMDCKEKESGIIYHTGSPIFDILLTTYMALSCLIYDDLTPHELIESLSPGDNVIYDNGRQQTRAEFIGITSDGSVKIKYGASGRKVSETTHSIPPSSFYTIKPYQGDATSLDGQKQPYLRGRKDQNGYEITRVTGIPADPSPRDGGTIVQSHYGDTPEVTRIEGFGNGG